MAVNIYDELAALSARIAKLEALHAPKTRAAPVTYFRPGAAWTVALSTKPALTMINPGSGPGTTVSGSYQTQVKAAQAAGVPVYGYVHSKGAAGYGTRPIAEIKFDVDMHCTWYGVDGIFIDCTSNKLEHVPYYAELCAYVHAKGRKAILNPGTQSLEEHAKMADYVMISEGTVDTYRARVARSWEANYKNLWHCVHSCPEADMPAVVALAKSRGAGLLYVTDDLMPNPYDTLCTYWSSLCALLAAP
jgi:hypothetical protein